MRFIALYTKKKKKKQPLGILPYNDVFFCVSKKIYRARFIHMETKKKKTKEGKEERERGKEKELTRTRQISIAQKFH